VVEVLSPSSEGDDDSDKRRDFERSIRDDRDDERATNPATMRLRQDSGLKPRRSTVQ
jgi:hypothetical protein